MSISKYIRQNINIYSTSSQLLSQYIYIYNKFEITSRQINIYEVKKEEKKDQQIWQRQIKDIMFIA